MRLARLFIAVLLLAAPCAAQDTAVLDGEPAIRFLAGHGHLTNYCEGELWITAGRIRFDGVTVPAHSFDYKRADVKDVHAASTFGFHYIKLEAGGHTYRMGIYPELEHALGDRLAFIERAWKDFPSAYAEVQKAEAARDLKLGLITVRDDKDGPVLEFPVLVGTGALWFSGPDGVTVWAGPEADKRAYAEIRLSGKDERTHARVNGDLANGTLEVTADHVRLVRASGKNIAIDEPRSQMRLKEGAGGYPQVVVTFRNAGRLTFLFANVERRGADGDDVTIHDGTLLLHALGPEFPQVVEQVRKASAK